MEQRDLLVPLALSGKAHYDPELLRRCERVMRAHLDRAAADGWHLAGSIAWPASWAAHRANGQYTRPYAPDYTYHSVTLRVRRAAAVVAGL